MDREQRRPSSPASLLIPLVLVFCLAVLVVSFLGKDVLWPPTASIPSPGQGDTSKVNSVLFCHWNVENLFDDRDDGRKGPGDKEYDGWLANHPDILKKKLAKLCDALMALNDGKGPDIIALVEVESVRAAELLREALNQRLADPQWHYQAPLMKEVTVGRHIAPAILTRLPAIRDRTRDFGPVTRILQGVIKVRDHELIVFATHWTSRLNDGSEQRGRYADKVYGAYRAIVSANPQADVLISGDLNDDPDDASVTKGLHATADAALVQSAQPPMLLNLMAGKNPKAFGTLYESRWHLFDQILVSPGLLDGVGWSCDAGSLKTINTLTRPGDRIGRPWRFGGEKTTGERGYSDHFPVVVRLRVAD